jgi:DNA-binding protein YbaB
VDGSDNRQLIGQLKERLDAARELRERLAELVGKGESLNGAIQAVYTDADGLTGLVINPRLMRLGSEELAERVVEAVRAARDDLAARKRSAAGPEFDPQLDPEALRARLDEATAVFRRSSHDVSGVLDMLRKATGG